MKMSSKLITAVFITAALFLTTNVNAQTTPAKALIFSAGADAGIPTGNLTIGSDFSLGGTLRLQYGITNNFAITLTSGADHFFSKIDPATGQRFDSFGVIPIKAGIKEFFVPNIYFGIEGGVAFEETDNGVGNTKTLISPAVGWGNKRWDVGIRYDSYLGQNDPYGLVVLRVAYGFKL
jgi:hypothetical protein